MKPIISKGHSATSFYFFQEISFLAFNSRDMPMLWVLNLFSRSSPTKLWKQIFKKISQKIFFDTWSWHAIIFSHMNPMGKFQIWVKNFDEKNLVLFYVDFNGYNYLINLGYILPGDNADSPTMLQNIGGSTSGRSLTFDLFEVTD